MSPLIGGGMKVVGKAGHELGSKDNVHIDGDVNKITQHSYDGSDDISQLSREELKQKLSVH